MLAVKEVKDMFLENQIDVLKDTLFHEYVSCQNYEFFKEKILENNEILIDISDSRHDEDIMSKNVIEIRELFPMLCALHNVDLSHFSYTELFLDSLFSIIYEKPKFIEFFDEDNLKVILNDLRYFGLKCNVYEHCWRKGIDLTDHFPAIINSMKTYKINDEFLSFVLNNMKDEDIIYDIFEYFMYNEVFLNTLVSKGFDLNNDDIFMKLCLVDIYDIDVLSNFALKFNYRLGNNKLSLKVKYKTEKDMIVFLSSFENFDDFLKTNLDFFKENSSQECLEYINTLV